jgi:DNA-nicking Smr family endonuclease
MTTKDKNLWDAYKHGVKPVQKKPLKTPLPPEGRGRGGGSSASAVFEITSNVSSRPPPPPTPSLKGRGSLVSVTLERKREKSLRQGNVEIDAKLDLHGMTQTEAFAALTKFMHKCVTAEKRQLLIITGKGKISEGGGVLRRNLGNWLAQLPEAPSILALRPAAPKHGGEGAVYVVMRRK